MDRRSFVGTLLCSTCLLAEDNFDIERQIAGNVTDGSKPIKNVKIGVHFNTKAKDDVETKNRVDVVSDDQGNYTIHVPKQIPIDSTNVFASFEHPKFGTYSSMGIPLSSLIPADNRKKIDARFRMVSQGIEKVYLKRILQLKGKVLDPDGKPVAGATIRTASRYRSYSWKFPNPRDYGVGDSAVTDSKGNFVVTADYDSTLVISHEQFAPILLDRFDVQKETKQVVSNGSETVPDVVVKRIFRLKKGRRITGTVFSHLGKPMPRVAIQLNRQFKWSEHEPQVSYGTTVFSDKNGKYIHPPLPDDSYELKVGGRLPDGMTADQFLDRPAIPSPLALTLLSQTASKKLQDHGETFVSQSITLTPLVDPNPYDLHALPHQTVTLKIEYPDGPPSEPSSFGTASIQGKINGASFYLRGAANPDGIVQFQVPKGLADARIDVGTSRFRKTPDGPLQLGNTIHLATIEKDVQGLLNVRPKLEPLKIDVVAADGDSLKSTQVNGWYVRNGIGSRSPEPKRFHLYINRRGEFEETHVLPDEEFVLHVKAEGRVFKYADIEKRMKLKSGEGGKISIKLQPIDDD